MNIPGDDLQQYVDCIDVILKDFNQPTFYKIPKFHTSLLWCLPTRDKRYQGSNKLDNSALLQLEEELKSVIEEINRDFQFDLENDVVSIPQM